MAPILVSFLVLTLSTLCVYGNDVFVSIDCGSSSDSYRDEHLIVWSGDGKYIKNGESRTVESNNSISHVMDTLRVFTDRKKNCYNIESVNQGRVLVRVSFYYGNYDKKSSPPSFDLQFDGNYWANVSTSITDYVYYEVIYVMKKDNISVCVAQTKVDQLPFISAIEIRRLEPHMYRYVDENFPLFLRMRNAYAANATIRFLGSFGLTGLLPDFSSLDRLEIIDCHNNSLNGSIPSFLGTFRNLKELNLANNKFSGPIPSSLSQRNGLNLVVTGNPDLCTPGKPCTTINSTNSGNSSGKDKKVNKLAIILGIVILSVTIIWDDRI